MGRRAFAIAGTLVFLVLAPGTVAGLVPWWLTGWRMREPLLSAAPLRWVGAALILAGLAVLLESFARFALRGAGTPAPVFPTERLVVTGLFRHVRNPMYCAVTAMILGQGLLLGDTRLLAYGAAVWLAFHLFVLLYEEPTLKGTYGPEYAAYRAAVPRWIPRIRRWRGGSAGQAQDAS